MTTVEAIENEIRQLSQNELANFRRWFVEFDSDAWDEQIEMDAADGKFDALAKLITGPIKNETILGMVQIWAKKGNRNNSISMDNKGKVF